MKGQKGARKRKREKKIDLKLLYALDAVFKRHIFWDCFAFSSRLKNKK